MQIPAVITLDTNISISLFISKLGNSLASYLCGTGSYRILLFNKNHIDSSLIILLF